MESILVISGHPWLDHSIANETILRKLEASGLDLSVLYLHKSGYDFDVPVAQDALREAKAVVFQFPVFWYSYPSLLKKWVEDVFAYGFAYGSQGTALKGKDFFVSCTTGSPEQAYCADGMQKHPIKEFFYNFEQIAALSGMHFHEPMVTYGCTFVPGMSPDSVKERIIKNAEDHADRLIEQLKNI